MSRTWLLTYLMIVSACGTATPPPPPSCTTSTCAGCCDARGVCQDGTGTAACGRLGLSCSVCQSGQQCVAGLCQGMVVGGGTGGGAAGGLVTGGGSVAGGGAAGGAVSSGGTAAGGDAGGGVGGGLGGGGSAGGTSGGSVPGGGAPGAGGAAGGTSTGGGAATPTRFAATFTRFSVPEAAFSSLRGSSGQRSWSTLDLNGDGRPDLAITSNPATGAVFSDALGPYWNVHLGTATGFATTPLLWRVPEIVGAPQGYNNTTSSTGMLHWSTFDITGDGRPEIVHTMNPISGGPYVSIMAEPADAWLSRRNVGSSFDTAGTVTLSVPRVTSLSGGIDRIASDLVGRRWTLAEVTGDTLVDLVITADPATDSMWLTGGGLSAWSVCPGSRLGFGAFSANCALLTVPSNGLAGGFRSASSTGPARWFLLDLNGDRRDDLIWSTAATGVVFTAGTAPVWRVYLNQSSPTALFAPTFTQWALPGAMFNAASGALGANQWATMDLDGDGLVELVHTADTGTGRPFVTANGPAWRLYPVTAARTGFSTTPTTWLVPTPTTLTEGFRAVAGTSWAVLDVTGDGRPDLVEYQDPLTGLAFSDLRGAFWHVYPGVP